jgi:hypothetical protein
VQQHLSTAESVAAGLRILPQTCLPMSAAQAAYRFYDNARVSLPMLAAPIIEQLPVAVAAACRDWCLVIHDVSPLHYTQHESKQDRIVLYNQHDFGYLLQTALLISDRNGAPLLPLYVGIEASDGVHSTRRETPLHARPWIDEISRTMGYVESLGPAKPSVHIIDREADSILHLRRFRRQQRKFLIRGNDVRRVAHEGRSKLLEEVESELATQFRFSREVQYKGRQARQYVAETTVKLQQPARQQRLRNGKKSYRMISGGALDLRLVLAQVRDQDGSVLATWRLWTNLPASVDAATIALWYYWRWRIESYFKLLKRAGQHAEAWQQETASAIAKRMLIAAQVCVIVWAIEQSPDPRVKPLRELLVRLSGRLMKRGVESTASALLAGMWNLLSIINALEQYSLAEIEQSARLTLEILGLEEGFKGFKDQQNLCRN